MSTRVRVRFSEFDITSEVGGLDGSTYLVVNVSFAVETDGGSVAARAGVGITSQHGRRSYEVVDETWARHPALAQALVDYVKDAEKIFRVPVLGRGSERLARTVDLLLEEPL